MTKIAKTVTRKELRPEFDIYALGKNLFRLLKYYDEADNGHITLYHRRYLEMMASRMLNEYIGDAENVLGLAKIACKEISYTCIEDIAIDIKKITGEYDLSKKISELNPHYPHRIQASQPFPASLTMRVANILSTSLIRRLSGISRAGLIAQIYPQLLIHG